MSNMEHHGEKRCDFCRLPCSLSARTLEFGGTTYEFCSKACRQTVQASDRVFTEYHGHRRFPPGVAGLDSALPQGMPRNSFVLLSGQAGTRDTAVHAELVWRALQRGEPAVVVSFREPPTSLVERFLMMDWNVLPYLEREQLRIVDCFTYRHSDRDLMLDRMSAWNEHLHAVTEPAVYAVRSPGETDELRRTLDRALEAGEMVESGLVVIDSLTEFGTLVQPVQAYDFVKTVRADVCKGRFVPVFAGATPGIDRDVFPHDLEYIADGVVDLALDDSLIEQTLIKRIRIRKLDGVLVYSKWVAYEYTGTDGMVTFSPGEELEDDGAATGDDAASENETPNEGDSAVDADGSDDRNE